MVPVTMQDFRDHPDYQEFLDDTDLDLCNMSEYVLFESFRMWLEDRG